MGKKEASGRVGGNFTTKEKTFDLRLEEKNIAVGSPERRGERSTLPV